jgi:hypothetical protein
MSAVHSKYNIGRRASVLAGTAALSAGMSIAIVMTSFNAATRLGVPQWWPWLLTGLQVTALWAAGTKRWWAWLLGAAVQPPWIVYAVLTDQPGFIPGCAVSAAVQLYSYLRRNSGESRAQAPSRLTVRPEGRGKVPTRWSVRPAITTRGDRHEPELLPCSC